MPGELKTSAQDHPPFQVKLEAAVSDAGPDPFYGPSRTAHINPVDQPGQGKEIMDRGMDRPPHRTAGTEHRLHPAEPGPCSGATHLCQVGTAPRHRPVQIELPQGKVSTEVEHRYPEPATGGNETAARTQNNPWLTVGGEQVNHPLKPFSTTTSDQQIGRATDAKRRPRAQIHPLVDLRFAAVAECAEVLFEAR